MTAVFLSLLCAFSLAAVFAVAFVWAISRNDHLRVRAPIPTIGTDVRAPLPRALAIPTVWRKERW